MTCPRFERLAVGNTEREVVEADRALVEPLGGRLRVFQQDHRKTARVHHAVTLPALPIVDVDEPEPQDPFPLLRAALCIAHRKIDVSYAGKRWDAHVTRIPHNRYRCTTEPRSAALPIRRE